jgi:hypothetical protein
MHYEAQVTLILCLSEEPSFTLLTGTGQITFYFNMSLCSRNSAVGIVTGYGLDGRGFGVQVPVVFSPRSQDRL